MRGNKRGKSRVTVGRRRLLRQRCTPFFSEELSRFRRLRHVLLNPKSDLDENTTATSRSIVYIPDEESQGLGRRRESRKNDLLYIYFFSDGFGLRSPVIQKSFQTKSATSIVAYVARCNFMEFPNNRDVHQPLFF